MQRRAVRILDSLCYRDYCKYSFRRLGILTLPRMFILECLLHLRKSLNDWVPHSSVLSHCTRNTDNLVTPISRLSRSHGGPHYLAVKFYNKLPNSWRLLPLNAFRAKVTEFLKSDALYSYDEFYELNFNSP